LVKDLGRENCEITIHNVKDQCESKICLTKMTEYSVKRLPAIAVDGKLLSCCTNIEITKENLLNAGIGIS